MIRPANAADVPGLVEAVEAAYAPFRDAGLELPPVSDGLDNDIRDNHVWVAVTGDRVLGGVVLVLGDHAHLANLAVHPDGAGGGLGRRLINVACDAAQAAGYGRIALATHAAMTGTRAFYARLGWSEDGRDGEKVMMSRSLG